MTPRPVRIILANDVDVVIQGLKGLLAPYGDRVQVVGTATGDPKILQEALAEAEADIMLIDAFGRSGAGVDAVEMVLSTDPPFRVAVYTEADDLRHLLAALRVGVRGYLLKSMAPADLVDALERITAGDLVVDSRLAAEAALLAARSTAHLRWPGAHLGLTKREAEVLRSIAKGTSVDGAARELGVGRETIRSHLQQVYRKLGVNDRAAAVAVAWREGLGG